MSLISNRKDRTSGLEIAVIGMHCRFPGTPSIESFWTELKEGYDGLTRFSAQQLKRAGVPRELYQAPNYIPVSGVLDGFDLFDHAFFGISAPDARLMDPQHRLLLECSLRALEDAGRAGAAHHERIGVFAGVSANTYLLSSVLPSDPIGLMRRSGLPLLLASDKDFAAPRIAYHLGLTGPAVTIQTACSTGLSVIHTACRALQAGDCDIAIAAAACVRVPQHAGYLYQEGSIFSLRGECRAFDADADGCVPGNGVAAVVLRRQEDAVEAGDTITAVVLGSALNNDAGDKLSFAAPSAEGQAQVIKAAHLYAEVSPGEIGYVEAHGTGTPLGDVIEVSALCEAFQGASPATCGLGSVKSNIGHLDTAAGLAGFIKAVMAVRYGKLPPTIRFAKANPHLSLKGSPFFIVDELSLWRTEGPRIAAVSSFGIGGTNAHIVLMEAPRPRRRKPSTKVLGLALSVSQAGQLPLAARALADHLGARPSIDLRDVAWTLFVGRRHLPHRQVVTARTTKEAIARLNRLAKYDSPIAAEEIDDESMAIPEQATRWIEGHVESLAEFLPAADERYRVSLPGTLLTPVRHWMEPSAPDIEPAATPVALSPDTQRTGPALRSWTWTLRPTQTAQAKVDDSTPWLLVHAGQSFAHNLADRLRSDRELSEVNVVADGNALLEAVDALASSGRLLRIVVVCVREGELPAGIGPGALSDAWRTAWRLPLLVARALTVSQHRLRAHVDLLTRGRFDVLGSESLDFGQWLVHGVDRVLTQECSGLTLRAVDWTGGASNRADGTAPSDELDVLIEELRPARVETLAIRGTKVWTRDLVELESSAPATVSQACLVMKSPILALGGFGGIGRVLTERIARDTPRAQIALIARDPGATVRTGKWEQEKDRIDTLFAGCIAEDPVNLIQDSPEVVEQILRFCCASIAAYWRDLGLSCASGSALTRSELAFRARVLPAFERMLDFQIACLKDNGYIRAEADTITWCREGLRKEDADDAAMRVRELEPELTSVVDLLEMSAESYPVTLSGKQEPISILYPQGSEQRIGAAARVMIRRSLGSAACRTLARWAGEAAAASDSRHPFRILEVGAGNGLLTREIAEVLQALPEGRAFLIATDIGRNLVEAGKVTARAAGWRDIEFGVLDITSDPAAQGFDPRSFDLVCGLNVVHATPKVMETLAGLRSLLAPGGVLAVIESVVREPWVDMVSGLAEDWWTFDDERRLSPLLSAQEWCRAFHRAGIKDVASFPKSSVEIGRPDCALILGVADDEARSSDTGLTAEASAHVEALRALGANVCVVFGDLCDGDSVRRAVADAREQVGPICSVVHSAGRIAGGLIRNLSAWEIDVEFAARVRGTLGVLEALRDDPVEEVVVSSSLNVLTGGIGQTAYVSANAVLSGIGEALKRERGMRVTIVHWDRWRGVGLGRTFEERYRKLKKAEIGGGLSVEEAVLGLAQARRLGVSDVVISARPAGAVADVSPRTRPGTGQGPVNVQPATILDDESPQGVTTRILLDFIARYLGTPPLSPDDRLVDLGVDSLGALELQEALLSTFKVNVFSAALITEPLQLIADAILDPAGHGATVEVADPTAVEQALRDYTESIG